MGCTGRVGGGPVLWGFREKSFQNPLDTVITYVII
jgi:hypothetical protein